MNKKNIYENLNPEQFAAVTATHGYVRVIAGPGTGKTRVLTSRLCYLINNGIYPENILCVTFTNKAANEMRERAIEMLGYQLNATMSTFHGFCYRFLKSHINKLNYPEQFLVMDAEYQLRFLREIYSENNYSTHIVPLQVMLENISVLKNSVEYIPTQGCFDLPLNLLDLRNKIFEKYILKQRATFALDFDDLLNFTLHILRRNKVLLEYYQEKYKAIMVDEFQDVNQAQYDLVTLLQDKHQNLFVVGDPDQLIYSWRGSKINYIKDFESMFPGTQTFKLTTNYRSSSSIVDACNALIKNNKNRIDNPLVSVTQSEGKVIHYHARNIFDEAHFIADAILSLKENGQADYSEIGLLYRSSFISRQLEEALIQSRIPYVIVKGTAFYDRQEVRDALAFLRLLVYGDDISFLRVINKPARKMSGLRLEFLKEYSKSHNISMLAAFMACCNNNPMFQLDNITGFLKVFQDIKSRIELLSVSQALTEILTRSGYEKFIRLDVNSDRIDNIQELKQSVANFEKKFGGKADIIDYLDEVALYAEVADDEQPNNLKLMTVHSAKGLEFKYVIVCGLNEGRFPSSKISSQAELEEERRLAYVAFTRAKEGLLLTSAGGVDYKNIPLLPSRFLSEIKPGLIRELKLPRDYLR